MPATSSISGLEDSLLCQKHDLSRTQDLRILILYYGRRIKLQWTQQWVWWKHGDAPTSLWEQWGWDAKKYVSSSWEGQEEKDSFFSLCTYIFRIHHFERQMIPGTFPFHEQLAASASSLSHHVLLSLAHKHLKLFRNIGFRPISEAFEMTSVSGLDMSSNLWPDLLYATSNALGPQDRRPDAITTPEKAMGLLRLTKPLGCLP